MLLLRFAPFLCFIIFVLKDFSRNFRKVLFVLTEAVVLRLIICLLRKGMTFKQWSTWPVFFCDNRVYQIFVFKATFSHLIFASVFWTGLCFLRPYISLLVCKLTKISSFKMHHYAVNAYMQFANIWLSPKIKTMCQGGIKIINRLGRNNWKNSVAKIWVSIDLIYWHLLIK